MRNTNFWLFLAVLVAWIATLCTTIAGCASFEATTPADRLCQPKTDAQYCYHQVQHADRQEFKTALTAARFGLAFLHQEYPNLESAGVVLKNREGKYVFEFAGVGEEDRINFLLPPKSLIWVHTHIKGTRNCSKYDEGMTLAVNQYLGRKVRSFVQHKSGSMVECKPRKHWEQPIRLGD